MDFVRARVGETVLEEGFEIDGEAARERDAGGISTFVFDGVREDDDWGIRDIPVKRAANRQKSTHNNMYKLPLARCPCNLNRLAPICCLLLSLTCTSCILKALVRPVDRVAQSILAIG